VATLQKTSISAWDFGIEKLNTEVADRFADGLEYDGFGPRKLLRADFTADDLLGILFSPTENNRGLIITVHLGTKKNGRRRTKSEFITDAVKVVNRVREKFRVNETREYEIQNSRFTGNAGIAYYFVPGSELRTIKAKFVRDQIEKVTTIKIWQGPPNDVAADWYLQCTATLLGTQFKCE